MVTVIPAQRESLVCFPSSIYVRREYFLGVVEHDTPSVGAEVRQMSAHEKTFSSTEEGCF